MVAPGDLAAWCWDARPCPDFPARDGLWSDAGNWALGHWLNGRAGAGDLADLVAAGLELADEIAHLLADHPCQGRNHDLHRPAGFDTDDPIVVAVDVVLKSDFQTMCRIASCSHGCAQTDLVRGQLPIDGHA